MASFDEYVAFSDGSPERDVTVGDGVTIITGKDIKGRDDVTIGADVYVANLVGLSITRELGPLMTAIIAAGRSGAAFAVAFKRSERHPAATTTRETTATLTIPATKPAMSWIESAFSIRWRPPRARKIPAASAPKFAVTVSSWRVTR